VSGQIPDAGSLGISVVSTPTNQSVASEGSTFTTRKAMSRFCLRLAHLDPIGSRCLTNTQLSALSHSELADSHGAKYLPPVSALNEPMHCNEVPVSRTEALRRCRRHRAYSAPMQITAVPPGPLRSSPGTLHPAKGLSPSGPGEVPPAYAPLTLVHGPPSALPNTPRPASRLQAVCFGNGAALHVCMQTVPRMRLKSVLGIEPEISSRRYGAVDSRMCFRVYHC
jgi:hypothetical protein